MADYDYLPNRIAGPRLLLRPPVLDDAGAVFQRVAGDPQVTRYLQWTPHPNVAATRQVITQRLRTREDERTWIIVLQHSGDVIGMISCVRRVRHSGAPPTRYAIPVSHSHQLLCVSRSSLTITVNRVGCDGFETSHTS